MMNYKLEFERRQRYLYVFVEVYNFNYQNLREYLARIAKVARSFPGRPVLVEKIEAKQLSTVDAFHLVSELPSLGFNNLKVAIVDHSEANDDINRFVETVAINRGLNIKSFSKIDAAEEWLLAESFIEKAC